MEERMDAHERGTGNLTQMLRQVLTNLGTIKKESYPP